MGREEGKHGLLHKPESFLNGKKMDSIFSKATHAFSPAKGLCETDHVTPVAVTLYMDVNLFKMQFCMYYFLFNPESLCKDGVIFKLSCQRALI